MFKKRKTDKYKFKTGDRITHVKYGTGTIIDNFTFHPPDNLYNVDFDNGCCTSGVPEDDLSEFAFKIGDRVKVIGRYGMGNTGVIKRTAENTNGLVFVVYFDNDCGAGAYIGEDLSLTTEDKRMTKSDLKNGMIAETRNGHKFFIHANFMDECFLASSAGAIPFESYCEDLTIKDEFNSEWDISRIYRRNPCGNPLTCLWERQPIKEVTISDIESKFGCKIKIVNKI